MNKTLEGIILNVKDYREYDVLMQVLTKEEGMQSLVAKGIRKINSKNAAVCQRFVQALFYIDYREGQTIHSMRTADKLHMFRKIREDLVKQSIASVLSDMLLTFYNDNEFDLYEEFTSIIQHINDSPQPYAAACLCLVMLLEKQGMKPIVEHCVKCGAMDKICSFSSFDGGFVCTNCATSEHTKETLTDLKCFRLLVMCDLKHYDVLETYHAWNFHHFEALFAFFEQYSGIRLKSMKFLRNIEHLN